MPSVSRPGIRTKPLGMRTRQLIDRLPKKQPKRTWFRVAFIEPLYSRIRSLGGRLLRAGR